MSRLISDIHDLVAAVDLEEIRKYEERARRVDTETEADDIRQNNSIGVERHFPEGFSVRVRTVIGSEGAEYVSDIAGVYSLDEPAEVTKDAMQEFVERVAFFAIYPFLRESIFSSATRLGETPPLMSLIKAGELELGNVMTEHEVRREFFDNKSELD